MLTSLVNRSLERGSNDSTVSPGRTKDRKYSSNGVCKSILAPPAEVAAVWRLWNGPKTPNLSAERRDEAADETKPEPLIAFTFVPDTAAVAAAELKWKRRPLFVVA